MQDLLWFSIGLGVGMLIQMRFANLQLKMLIKETAKMRGLMMAQMEEMMSQKEDK